MPLGSPGFFRDKWDSRLPAAVDIAFLFDTSLPNGNINAGVKSPDFPVYLETALRSYKVGISQPNFYMQGDHRHLYDYRSGVFQVDGATLLADPTAWGRFQLTSIGLGTNVSDVTGGTLALINQIPSRPGIPKIIISSSIEQPAGALTSTSSVIPALQAAGIIFIGISGYGTLAMRGGQGLGGIFAVPGSTTFDSINGGIFPISEFKMNRTYGSTSGGTMTAAQVINGPIEESIASQRCNTPHMAYMTYGAFISLGAIRASYGNDDYAILGSILGSVFGAIFYAAT